VEWWSESIEALTPFRNPRFQSIILGTFAVLALVLTALGTFSIVAFLVAARTRELGIRLALGAPRVSVIRLVLGRMMVPVVAGLLIGLLTLWWTAQFARAALYQVETNDPATLLAAVATVLAAAFIAAWVPARRASLLDPVVALRQE
jgi:putative ABC transport system permease protein